MHASQDRFHRFMLAAVASLLAFCGPSWAQDYPQKPIRIIVPFSTGGIADVFARALGQKLTEAWSQPVIVENRTGAAGNMGAEVVAKAAPDAIRCSWATLARTPSMFTFSRT